MWITQCTLELHESLFFATRELGRLYETGRYLHNYALTYAFGFVENPFHISTELPQYQQLEALNAQGIYVTPAQPLDVRFQITTFKYGEEILHVQMEQATRNTPSFGRAKEIAVGSSFCCYIYSPDRLIHQLPGWIRLGKWMSKTKVEYQEFAVTPVTVDAQSSQDCVVPLNPRDLTASVLQTFDIVSMPPSSLITNVKLSGRIYRLIDQQAPDKPKLVGVLPADVQYVIAT